MITSLDLGCGRRPRNPFLADEVHGIDVRDEPQLLVRRADLVVEPIPHADGFFDFVTAHDFIEHVPRLLYAPERRTPFIALMNEIHRVLKPDGLFLSVTPAYPRGEAFRDPTHVNIITEETFPFYFDDEHRWASAYGFSGAFVPLHQEWRGPHLWSILQKAPAGSAAGPAF